MTRDEAHKRVESYINVNMAVDFGDVVNLLLAAHREALEEAAKLLPPRLVGFMPHDREHVALFVCGHVWTVPLHSAEAISGEMLKQVERVVRELIAKEAADGQ